MKLKAILSGVAALALAATAHADVTIYVTGSTAFRAGTIDSIKNAYLSLGGSASFKYSHDAGAGGVLGSTRSIWQGTFPGITGTTTIACTFTGSVEGVRALGAPGVANNATYLTTAALPGTLSTTGVEASGVTSPTAQQTANFAFSDVRQSSTPVTAALQPASPKVGVVVFTPMASKSATASFNVTAQSFKALFSKGFQPLSLFTNNSADTTRVIATGRNDGSGTRTTYLAESGFGITNLVQQYVVNTSGSGAMSVIQRVPAGGGSVPANASTVWGQDVDGNGGYNSGGTLRGDLQLTSTSVQVLDADGSDFFGSNIPLVMVGVLGTADAATAKVGGAKVLTWNGVGLDFAGASNTLSTSDISKIAYGTFTMWSFENLYYVGSLTADQNTFYTALKSGITTRLTANPNEGLPTSTMHVTRADDGAPVAP